MGEVGEADLSAAAGVALDAEAEAAAAAVTAEACKHRGNAHFKQQEFEEAIAAYSEAIQHHPQESSLWLNRSIAQRQLKNWEDALQDTSRASELDPKSVKAQYGRALCLQHLGRLEEAYWYCEAGLELEAGNKALQQLRNEVQQAHTAQCIAKRRQEAFSRAVDAGPERHQQRRRSSSNSSGSSATSDSSDGAGWRPPKKEPRPLTPEDAPYQELCECASKGDLEGCERLLASGQIKDLCWQIPEDGNTALHLAADGGHEAVAKALVEARASVELGNDFGLAPLALAEKGSQVYSLLVRMTRRLALERRRDALKYRDNLAS